MWRKTRPGMELVMEVGPCEGSLSYALEAADAIKEAAPEYGAMKAQWYTSATITQPDAPRYDHTPGDAKTQGELFDKVIDWDGWYEVVTHCRKIGLPFFPTVFSFEAIQKAQEMGLSRAKIASADITHERLIRMAAETFPYLVLSTGGATQTEIEVAIDWARSEIVRRSGSLTVLACHLGYPSSYEQANLARVKVLQGLKDVLVGYSDHTRGVRFLDILMGMGAEMWEKHFTLKDFYPKEGDHSFAIDEIDLKIIEETMLHVADYIGPTKPWSGVQPTDSELEAIKLARRSIVAGRDIPEGALIQMNDLDFLRPEEGGLSASRWRDVVNTVSTTSIPKGTQITPEMVDRSISPSEGVRW